MQEETSAILKGQGARIENRTVSRKAIYDAGKKALGRELRSGEFAVIARLAVADLKNVGEEWGAGVVEMINSSGSCADSAEEVNNMIMGEGREINDPGVAIVCLAALDKHFLPGASDCVGAQEYGSLGRRLT